MNDVLNFKATAFIFFFCFSIIAGTAYTFYDHYDFSHSTDAKSYIKMAEGDYNVKIVHRYRVLIPFLASSIEAPIGAVYKFLWPERDSKLQGLMLSFLIVNVVLTSLAGAFIILTCLHYGASLYASFLAILAFLTSSWTAYVAGLPLIDSLYLLVIALTLYGIAAHSKAALIFAIIVGPFAKESFLLIAPLILLFGRDTLSLKYQVVLFLVSGALVFSFRYYMDTQLGIPSDKNIEVSLSQIHTIPESFKNIFSFRGMGELLRVWGLFSFVLVIGFLGGRSAIKEWSSKIDWPLIGLFVVILMHMLLSSSLGRMLYAASPAFVVIIALIFDRHPFFKGLRELIYSR